jgi:hypothetical protein
MKKQHIGLNLTSIIRGNRLFEAEITIHGTRKFVCALNVK